MSVFFICSGIAIICSLIISLTFFHLTILGWFNCCCHSPRTTESVENIKNEVSHIMQIPTVTYKKENENEETNTESECVLCLSPFEDGECIRQLPSCNHVFHASCIDVWLSSHSECPLCRTPVHHVACRTAEAVICQVVDINSLQIELSPHVIRSKAWPENMV
ncbi:E3 ubiquitin-protein ligase ATL6, partial [Cucurbita argyrosperma subsp. argyrosperma]